MTKLSNTKLMKNTIFKLLIIVNIILMICVSCLWILRLEVQDQREERMEMKELKRIVATKGDIPSYNMLLEQLFSSNNPLELEESPFEEYLPYAFIMNDIYNKKHSGSDIYFCLKNIYHSYGLELGAQTRPMMESLLLDDLKMLENDSVRDNFGVELEYIALIDLFESSNKMLSVSYAMKLKVFESKIIDIYEELGKTGDRINKEGIITRILRDKPLYRIDYMYSYGDSTYNGVTYKEDSISANDRLQLYVSSQTPELSIEKHIYEVCEDALKDLKGINGVH